MSRTLVIGLAVLFAAIAAWFALAARAETEVHFPSPDSTLGTVPMPKGAAIGISGCLASACHGAPAEQLLAGKINGPTWMSSGSCWFAADPHAGTFDLLTDHPRRPVRVTAGEMMKRLGSPIPATEDSRCLACHTNPSLANPDRGEPARVLAIRREGIGCEGCHGNAGGWLREHTAGSDRVNLSASGMTIMTAVPDRAAVCMGCHVGAPRDRGYPVRDMNHDMIAAGHPRLHFDFGESMRRLPRHWDKKKTQTNPAREWLLGRVARAEAACKLLADRADRAARSDSRTPWPEFAEYNCASCHHAIPDPPRVDTLHLEDRRAGTLSWQTIWPATTDPRAGRSALAPVLASMRNPGSREHLSELSSQAAHNLAALKEKIVNLPDADIEELARSVFQESLLTTADTDLLGQLLLGLSSLERSTPRLGADAVEAAFDQYRQRDWAGVRRSLKDLLPRMQRR
ncbi:MAG TPA: multiheme c-type cytochrome [Gemmata sp.]|nr:multiheme c-type cytochrome [Gemmata sp.]